MKYPNQKWQIKNRTDNWVRSDKNIKFYKDKRQKKMWKIYQPLKNLYSLSKHKRGSDFGDNYKNR